MMETETLHTDYNVLSEKGGNIRENLSLKAQKHLKTFELSFVVWVAIRSPQYVSQPDPDDPNHPISLMPKCRQSLEH